MLIDYILELMEKRKGFAGVGSIPVGFILVMRFLRVSGIFGLVEHQLRLSGNFDDASP